MDVQAPQKQAEVVTDVQRKKIEKEYKCLECGIIFSKYINLYDHKKRHKGIIYRCAQCPSTFQTLSGLHYHSKTEHELRKFECHHCQTTFKAKVTLKSHMTVHFNSIVYPCNQCSAQFVTHVALRHHSLICSKTNVKNLNCIDVPARQKQAQVLTDVKNVVEKEYKCLACGKIFSNYQKYYKHKKIHEGIIYRCVQCPSTYKSISGLNFHLKKEHELRRFECHHCHTTFKTKNSLVIHMSVHFNSIEKEYKCLECGKIFTNYQTFYKHKKMHQGMIYRCVQCPSTYPSSSGLQYHSKTVHALRKFECHYCQTTFKAKYLLKRHMSMHSNSIVYPCNQCPAQFFKLAALRHHSLICSKSNVNNLNCIDVPAPQKQAQIVTDVKNVEKKYKCLECGKIFSNYQKFYRHKKMHEGTIYRCVQCPSTYKSKNGLKYHVRTEHELRKFECHHCQTTFKAKYLLKRHMSMHSNSINAALHHHTLIFPKSNVNNLSQHHNKNKRKL
jgi:KRAB domain-containing zinc finger protein